MSTYRKKILLTLAFLLVGVASAVLLASAREKPARAARAATAPLVEIVAVDSGAVDIEITGHGTVEPREEVQIVPQVAGRIARIHPALVAGGEFGRGAVLFEIENIDFQLAVERAAADVARAEVRLETEQAEAEIAREDWARLEGDAEPPSSLVLREPQVRQAEAEVAAARANLAKARLDLARTRITAPFDGRVTDERVDVGQFVVAGQSVATIYATDRFDVPIPLEDRELAWFDVPGERGAEVGSPVLVSTRFGGERVEWMGRVVRTAGVDALSRLVTVVVEVTDEASADRPRLQPGMFVDVAISGRQLPEAFSIPRAALRFDDIVWVVEGDELRMRPVTVVRTNREEAIVTRGLEPGARLVTSALDAATDGMAIRVAAGAES